MDNKLDPMPSELNESENSSKQSKSEKRPMSSKKKVMMIGTIMIALCLIITIILLAGFFAYRAMNSDSSSSEEEEMGEDETEEEDVELEPFLDMSADKIFFIRLMDREDISDNELWVVDADGLNAQSLGITGVNGVYNSTNDKIAVFSKANIYNKLFILDLETGEVEEIIEEDIDDAATANINANTTSISPDENIVAYSLNYYGTDCEDDGPCDYTEDPEVKSGFYAYNIATGERTYIGSFTYISSWSDDSQFVYSDGLGTDEYGNKTVKVNVETGVSALLDTKTNNLDSYYYISDNEKLILTGKTTGLETYTLKTFSLNEVFEEEVFAEVQSIRTEGCSDDEMYCIYQKRSNTISSTPIYKYRIINTETAEVEDLLVPEANENTGFAYWIDNEGIFTLVDVDTDYANYNSNELDQDIVFVDQETGVRMHLTDFGDVIFY